MHISVVIDILMIVQLHEVYFEVPPHHISCCIGEANTFVLFFVFLRD